MGWIKSSYSDTMANCVEVSLSPRAAAVRDSKRAGTGVLAFGPSAWGALVSQVTSRRLVR